MHSKVKWLVLIHLLLAEQALCRAQPPPPASAVRPLPSAPVLEEGGTTTTATTTTQSQPEDRGRSAQRILSTLRAKFQGPMQGRIHIQGNASCEELLSASDPSSALFPRELLGLSLVPVLVAAGCPAEAHVLVLRLYELLGVDDTEELLMELEGLMERGPPRPRATTASSSAASPVGNMQAERRLQAVMFNIQQLARAGEGEWGQGGGQRGKQASQCQGWARVNGTLLLGEVVEGATGGLEEAVRACEGLGARCAGVTRGGALNPGLYQAVMKPGSRAVPSERPGSECWIRQCQAEEERALFGRRARRSLQGDCVDQQEQRVHGVVEWIPGVSTLYNLGTAMYYATVNCSETAKERAILSAVDLGTDALMAVTGGTAGVAGYALGAGVKTGVKAGIKYLLRSMKQEDDVMVNQYSWEEGVITMQ